MNTSGQGISTTVRLMICLLGMAYPLLLSSQGAICEGRSGDNIFTLGDFGSGAANIVQMNPGYAPGFQYTTQVPPDDGEYTVTNDMRLWPNIFGSWLRIGDNDLDDEGYMMVINASFSPGIFYEQIIDNLCENTLYEFSADIINIIRREVPGHILPNVSFLIDDVVRYASGQIPQDENWHTYGFTFTTGPGQFAAKLSLRNNAPGGVGNDLALDNISFKPCGPDVDISLAPEGRVCENGIFPILTAHIEADTGVLQWQISLDAGLTWNDISGADLRQHQIQPMSAGQYHFRYIYSSTPSSLSNPKCRIVSRIIAVEVVAVDFMIRDTICEGLTVEIGGVAYGETGIFQETLVASNGCDSIITLDLVVVPDPPIVADFGSFPTSCEGASDGAVFLISVTGTRPPFDFVVGDSLVTYPNTILNLPAGTYLTRIENEYGCFAEETITVGEGPPFEVTTIDDTTIILGHSVLLTAWTTLPSVSSLWSPPTHIACPFCLDTYVTPVSDQTYVIEAMTAGGCTDKDSVTIRVDRSPVIYVPNIFSPNGDQINDYFTATTDPFNIRSLDEVLIFDRWGGTIAHATDLIGGPEYLLWDGSTSKGFALPGAYVYLLTFTMADGVTRSVSGDVTLIR